LLNHCLPTHKLCREKETGRPAQRAGVWRGAETPDARVLPAADVSPAKQAQLQDLHASLNPLQLGREIGRRKQERSATRAAGLKSNGRWLTPPALQRREERGRTNPGGPASFISARGKRVTTIRAQQSALRPPPG
jgi:hypothetical protein